MTTTLPPTLPIVPRNQAWPGRREMMETLARAAFQEPVSALEIGVWFGQGSTQVWMDTLRPGSTLHLLDSWKPYASAADLADTGFDYRQMDGLATEAFLSAFLNVRRFEGERPDSGVRVQMTRADSQAFLPLLKDRSFDLIYIDGDHKYEKVKFDIQQAKRLVTSDFGVICGDDLEKLPSAELVRLAWQHRDRDYLREEKFHPGVLLAVAEEFTRVNMVNGFWWIACLGGEFTTEVLAPRSAEDAG